MSLEEQRNQQQNKQESEHEGGGDTDTVITAATTHSEDDDDADCYETDPELARNRSKLRVLYHAATCPCEEVSECPAGVVYCCASKRVFAHMITCTAGSECGVPGCQHSRRVWRHYRNCGRNGGKVPSSTPSTTISSSESKSNSNGKGNNSNGNDNDNGSCDMCSAVPVPHNADTLCSRFRKRTSRLPLPLRSRGARNVVTTTTTTDDNTSVDVNSVEVAVGQDSQRGGSRDQYDRLPVWRKRNLLHAQQQQYQEQQLTQLPQYEQENNATTTTTTAFTSTASGTEMKGFNRRRGGGGSSRSALRASEASFNQSVRQIPVNSSNDHHKNKFNNNNNRIPQSQISHSPLPISRRTTADDTANYKNVDVPDDEDDDNDDENKDKDAGSDFSGSSSRTKNKTTSVLPKQLAAHPRDAKRRPNGPKPVARRSSQRVIQRVDPVY